MIERRHIDRRRCSRCPPGSCDDGCFVSAPFPPALPPRRFRRLRIAAACLLTVPFGLVTSTIVKCLTMYGALCLKSMFLAPVMNCMMSPAVANY
jgi:hypothetical protein